MYSTTSCLTNIAYHKIRNDYLTLRMKYFTHPA